MKNTNITTARSEILNKVLYDAPKYVYKRIDCPGCNKTFHFRQPDYLPSEVIDTEWGKFINKHVPIVAKGQTCRHNK